MSNDQPRSPSRDLAGFPPGRDYVLLPRRPRSAAVAGLALYDPSLVHQRVAAIGGRLLLRLGLAGVLPVRGEPKLPDSAWWHRWLAEVVTPKVGAPAVAAFRAGHAVTGNPPRVTALLMAADGRPLAFAKLSPAVEGGSRLGADALRLLDGTEDGSFHVPRLLGVGAYEGAEYVLQAPMPARHVGAGRRPDLVAVVAADVRRRLAGLARPSGTPAGHVPVHTALSPGNLRLDRAGQAWLIDWDKAQWGPPGTDELRYWLAYYARRPGPRSWQAGRVAALAAGGDGESALRRALEWRIAFRPEEPDRPQQQLRDAVAARLGVSAAPR